MSDYLDSWRGRTLGSADNLLEAERNDMMEDFECYLEEHALSAHDVYYTKPGEIPVYDEHQIERMAFIDVANNDKTTFDEKYVLCRNTCEVDVGSYILFKNNWYIVEFEEVKSTSTHKKYTIKKCNNILKFKYKGEVVKIPANIASLSLYSTGEKDYKYMSMRDGKLRVYVGANYVTEDIGKSFRFKINDSIYQITDVNKVDFTRTAEYLPGMICWMAQESINVPQDEEDLPYNPNSESEDTNPYYIEGKDYIYMGMSNTYSVEYIGNVIFEIDPFSYLAKVKNIGNNQCELFQDFDEDYDMVGHMIELTAIDEATKKVIDVKKIMVRGV